MNANIVPKRNQRALLERRLQKKVKYEDQLVNSMFF